LSITATNSVRGGTPEADGSGDPFAPDAAPEGEALATIGLADGDGAGLADVSGDGFGVELQASSTTTTEARTPRRKD
jgi:hypothetical protein